MKKTGLICLLLFFSVFFEACELAAREPHILQLETPEKIVEVYYANEEYFNSAADTVLKFDGKVREIGICLADDAKKLDDYAGKEINGLYIEGSSTLLDSDYQILYEAFAPLTERCHCRAWIYNSQVEFVLEGPTYGMAAKLFYFLDSDFAAEYMSKTDESIQINPHWYAIIWHD